MEPFYKIITITVFCFVAGIIPAQCQVNLTSPYALFSPVKVPAVSLYRLPKNFRQLILIRSIKNLPALHRFCHHPALLRSLVVIFIRNSLGSFAKKNCNSKKPRAFRYGFAWVHLNMQTS